MRRAPLFAVPQDKKDPSVITNTQRIDGAMPTIKHCLEALNATFCVGKAPPSNMERELQKLVDKMRA